MHHFSQVSFDEALIQKYNRQGPRYTSYPTALEFAPIEDGTEANILQQKDPAIPLSLYIHIPFCRHLCYYTVVATKSSPKKTATQVIIWIIYLEKFAIKNPC